MRLSTIALTLVASTCVAGQLDAQVVQLPTTRTTSYIGSVSVPDGGTASLGGVRYGRSNVQRSPLGYSYAHRSSAGSMSVSAQIIDLKALDDAILTMNSPVAAGKTVLSSDSPAADGSRNFLGGSTIGSYKTGSSRPAPDAWHRMMAAGHRSAIAPTHPGAVEAKIRDCLRRGKAAESSGRVQAARVYYRMAIQAMTPDMFARYEKILAERKLAKEKDEKAASDAGRKSF
ncbi:MAG: hypothetical protein Aurels2KO_11540 [Aureliella sp.]